MRKWTFDEIEFLIKNEKNMNSVEVSKHINRTVEAIRKKRKSLGLIGTDSMSAKRYTYDSDFFENIDSEKKAYWLGFISADGCISSRGKGKRLKITLKIDDKSHLQKFLNDIKSDIPVREKSIKNNVSKKEYNTAEIIVNSTKMCNDLCSHGIVERKTKDMENMPLIREDLIKHYIRGFYDGDGSIYFTKRKGFEDKYKQSIELVGYETGHILSVKKHLEELGIKSNIYQKRENNLKLSISSKRDSALFLKYIYMNSDTYLDRKKLKAIELYQILVPR